MQRGPRANPTGSVAEGDQPRSRWQLVRGIHVYSVILWRDRRQSRVGDLLAKLVQAVAPCRCEESSQVVQQLPRPCILKKITHSITNVSSGSHSPVANVSCGPTGPVCGPPGPVPSSVPISVVQSLSRDHPHHASGCSGSRNRQGGRSPVAMTPMGMRLHTMAVIAMRCTMAVIAMRCTMAVVLLFFVLLATARGTGRAG